MDAMLALFRRFTIRLRMRSAIAIVLALFMLVGAAGWFGGQRLAALSRSTMAGTVGDLQRVAVLRAFMGEIRQHEKNMVIDYEDGVAVLKHREAWLAATAGLKKALAAMAQDDPAGAKAPAREAHAAIEAYVAATTRVTDQIQNGAYDNARAADKMLARAKQHVAEAEQHIAAIEQAASERAASAQAEFGRAMQRTAVVFGAVFIVVALIVVPLTLLNSRSITEPILAARDLANAIATGDLTRSINAQGTDEAAELARALNHMREALAGLVGQLRQASDTIHVSTVEVASGNTNLSQRTEQAASNLQQTAASMEQLTGSVRQTAQSAQAANQLAADAAGAAQRGGQVVTEVVATMEEINRSSQRIADITGTIDGIAFQTNILALNAAVEAARAGEQGRGFAVVAGEVRALAQRAATAAHEIKGLIGSSVERVGAGTVLARDAGATMTSVVAGVKHVSQVIGEITHSAGEQDQGIGQINTAVSALERMTQENAALVEQAAAASEALKQQSQRLTQAVAGFRLSQG